MKKNKKLNSENISVLKPLLKKHWGYEKFYGFQKRVIDAVLNDRDTLSVISTGGGKSLCYQLPALMSEGCAVVISPLISLMHDQVSALKDMGIRADFINSTILPEERNRVWRDLTDGRLDLIYLAPERLVFENSLRRLQSANLKYFAIDEAHCISQWGHDFREDYLELNKIKKLFNGIAIHAFTATATPEVRKDICRHLDLVNPFIYVGDVNRKNLVYRARPRNNIKNQVTEVLQRHSGECGIIYCLRRKDVDNLTDYLQKSGYDALPYHAGLSDEERRYGQKRFQVGSTDIIVATIAFGMGIDRADVRFIIHAAMPKSMEHYQQQAGRAGRDGDSAECILFFSGSDYYTWKHLLADSPKKDIMLEKLNRVYNYCHNP
ncbi:MAG: ATP-dependent DNA helicase RecQ, partial [Elusimicrobiota bacterium]|nr:ATP-dependent DNA helicase RecQ [Elusimicrobiota bacterium]